MQAKTNLSEAGVHGQGDTRPTAVAGAASAVSREVTNVFADAKDLIRASGGARKTAVSTDVYVHDQAWKVIGASAAAAFLAGGLVARRR